MEREFDAVECAVEHDRLVGVELEVASSAGERDGRVVAEHVVGDHCECFGLGRVSLAGIMLE